MTPIFPLLNSISGTATDYCTFYGVSCSGGVLTSLQLQNNGLFGSIPTSIGNLGTSLTQLYACNKVRAVAHALDTLRRAFGLNNVTGGVPESVYGLTSLQLLDFSQNLLTGTVSNSIGSLTALTTLYFGGVQTHQGTNLIGTIPSAIGLCTRLQYLCARVRQTCVICEVESLAWQGLCFQPADRHHTIIHRWLDIVDFATVRRCKHGIGMPTY